LRSRGKKGDISVAGVIPQVQRNDERKPEKMAHRVAVTEGVLERFSGGFVHERERR
jgi:hypothetical protein